MSAKVFLIDEYVPRENESGSDDIIDFNPFLRTNYFRVICISLVKCLPVSEIIKWLLVQIYQIRLDYEIESVL